MKFEQDIFISYAHLDNQPLAEGLDGWVEALHERLGVILAQLLGEKVKIWRDRKLQGNDVFSETLVGQVSKAAVLVSVISPRYVKSDWCLRELETFNQHAAQLGDKTRVFKVVKNYVPRGSQPPQMQSVLGYEFYEYDAERGRATEFGHEVVPQKDPRYWAVLNDLAWDIKQTLEALKAAPEAATAPAPTSATRPAPAENAEAKGKAVYLATTTSDVSAERDLIRRELQQRGFQVFPDCELPLQSPDFEKAVSADLARCALSVHLVGARYGIVPEGEERSCVHLQEALAAERGGTGADFSRLIWMPAGLESQDHRQQPFIEGIQRRLGAGAELLQTSVEDLKLRVLEKLEPPAKPPAASEGDVKSVYLICDDQDAQEVAPLEDHLYDAGYEVIPTIPEGDQQQLAQYHRESLVNCDAALIYYGRANQMWLRSKLWDLQKAQGWGRQTPLRAKAVYVSAPQTTEKQRFRTREVPVVIQNFEGFTPDALSPFIKAMSAEDAGQK